MIRDRYDVADLLDVPFADVDAERAALAERIGEDEARREWMAGQILHAASWAPVGATA